MLTSILMLEIQLEIKEVEVRIPPGAKIHHSGPHILHHKDQNHPTGAMETPQHGNVSTRRRFRNFCKKNGNP